jgi:hypothetical protein
VSPPPILLRLTLYRWRNSQLGDIRRDPPRFVFREQLGGRSPARLILEIDVGKSLPASIADNLASSTFQGAAKRCRPSL